MGEGNWGWEIKIFLELTNFLKWSIMILWKWQGLVFDRISFLKNFFGKWSIEIRVQQTPLAICGPLVFVNNILLEYGLSHLFMCSLWLLLWYSDRGKKLYLLKWSTKPQDTYYTLYRKVCQPVLDFPSLLKSILMWTC